MGEVAAKIVVMPKDAETDLGEIKDSMREELSSYDVRDVFEEDVAFGLKKLVLTVVVADEEGGTEEVEDRIRDLDGVENVSVEDVNRLM